MAKPKAKAVQPKAAAKPPSAAGQPAPLDVVRPLIRVRQMRAFTGKKVTRAELDLVAALAELPEADALRDHFKAIRSTTLAQLADHLETFERNALATAIEHEDPLMSVQEGLEKAVAFLSDVVIEEGEIYDLVHDELDVLVTMSQQSFDAYRGALVAGGLLFYESDLVIPAEDQHVRSFGLQATDIAFKEFGRKIIANILMIGFANSICQVVSYENLAKTIAETVAQSVSRLKV